jgi:hypothetical protein
MGLKNNLIAVSWEDHEIFFLDHYLHSCSGTGFGGIASAQMLPP